MTWKSIAKRLFRLVLKFVMPDTAMESEDEAFRFMENSDRRLFQVIQGYLGIVRTTAQTDDKIFFVLRSTVPFVFRKTNLPVEYELVSEA